MTSCLAESVDDDGFFGPRAGPTRRGRPACSYPRSRRSVECPRELPIGAAAWCNRGDLELMRSVTPVHRLSPNVQSAARCAGPRPPARWRARDRPRTALR
jgi:hypothetical protein